MQFHFNRRLFTWTGNFCSLVSLPHSLPSRPLRRSRWSNQHDLSRSRRRVWPRRLSQAPSHRPQTNRQNRRQAIRQRPRRLHPHSRLLSQLLRLLLIRNRSPPKAHTAKTGAFRSSSCACVRSGAIPTPPPRPRPSRSTRISIRERDPFAKLPMSTDSPPLNFRSPGRW